MEKCGSEFEPHLTPDLFDLVFTALGHTNRFVRETGYKVIAAIIKIPGQYLHMHICVYRLFNVLLHTYIHVHAQYAQVHDSLVHYSLYVILGLSAATRATYWADITLNLAKGLSDNWSQV